MKYLITLFLISLSFFGKTQEIVEEIIPIDTSFITYKVVYRETIGDYFQLKRAVFANDTAVVAIEKNYSNGHQNGLTRIYYPSGKLRVKAIYGNDKLQGEWTHYNEEGLIIIKGVYNFGNKNGYWAYKSEKTYGRYNKKGLKHRKWIKKDVNNHKHKAFYWNGKLKSGSDIFEKDFKTHADTLFAINTATNSTDTATSKIVDVSPIDDQHILVLKHIAQNYYHRKASKDYFRNSKKERGKFINQYVNLEKDVFRFSVAPYSAGISIQEFLIAEKLSKPTIDSLLKANGQELEKQLQATSKNDNPSLSIYSTDKNSTMLVYLSNSIGNLVVVELVELTSSETTVDYNKAYTNTEFKHMKMVLLFNGNNEIIEVEYQKSLNK